MFNIIKIIPAYTAIIFVKHCLTKQVPAMPINIKPTVLKYPIQRKNIAIKTDIQLTQSLTESLIKTKFVHRLYQVWQWTRC
jgi:hypothetical protein